MLEAGVVVDVRVMVVVMGPESLEEFVIANVGLMLPESPSTVFERLVEGRTVSVIERTSDDVVISRSNFGYCDVY